MRFPLEDTDMIEAPAKPADDSSAFEWAYYWKTRADAAEAENEELRGALEMAEKRLQDIAGISVGYHQPETAPGILVFLDRIRAK